MLSAFMFISCEKDDALNQDAQNLNSESQLDKDIQILPFFEVAKGDSISKGVYREKPEVSEMDTDEVAETADEDLSVLRSTSGSSADEEVDVVVDIQARSFNRSTDAPSSYWSFPSYSGEPAKYYKINYDLNKKAGGKYIYFYVGFMEMERSFLAKRPPYAALRAVTAHGNKKAGDYTSYVTKKMTSELGGFVYDWHKLGTNGCGEHIAVNSWADIYKIYKGTGKQVDLNEGAGGDYIYLFGSTKCRNWDYIVNCKVANYTRSKDGYRCRTGDLNNGAGGGYIYLHTKHLTW